MVAKGRQWSPRVSKVQGQVHSNGITKQVFVKEDGNKGDEEQEDGG